MHNYRELGVWKKSRELVKEVYILTEKIPKSEQYGITNQIRRCAVSIPSNIAEGAGRSTDKDFANFLSISLGSSYELETQLLLAVDLEFITDKNTKPSTDKLIEIQKMIFNLRRKLK